MRRAHRLLLLLPLAVTGCRYPEDPFFAYGRVLQADGSPLAGATLTVERAPPRFLDMGEEGGLERPPSFKPYGTFTTQADGDFTQQFLSGDVEQSAADGSDYVQYRFRLALPLEDGQGTFVSFVFNGDMELPTLQPWAARFTVAEDAAGPWLSFAPAPAAAELPPSGKVRTFVLGEDVGGEQVTLHPTTPEPIVQLFTQGARLWAQQAVSAPWVPGPYVLEDFASPQAQLRAVSLGAWLFTPLGAPSSSVDFRQEWRTALLPLRAGALRPVSRGASCQPSPPGACPWTDGQLAPVTLFPRSPGELPYSLVITLAEPKRLSRAVIRGLEHGHVFIGTERLLLEGSGDGEAWFPLSNTVLRTRSRSDAVIQSVNETFADNTSWDSPFDGKLEQFDRLPLFLDVPLENAQPVQHVRLRVEAESQELAGPRLLFSLAELSLFE